MTVNEPVADTFEDTPARDRDPDWFKRAVFYEVLVRSFHDSNGDGIGDLKGLTAKLDYLQWLGVDCLWLPPFFTSPLKDGGYDVSDYTAVLPEFGDLADFVEFVDAAHQRGIHHVDLDEGQAHEHGVDMQVVDWATLTTRRADPAQWDIFITHSNFPADPTTINRATRLLWVSHNLERIADRATNICERVVFAVTGALEEINVSTY